MPLSPTAPDADHMPAWTIHQRSQPGRARLTLIALRLGLRAQAIKREPLASTLSAVLHAHRASANADPLACAQAAARAAALLGRFGLLGNCIVRALITAALLAQLPKVALHIGFRDATVAPVDGHAWVTLDGRPVMDFEAHTYRVANTFNISEHHGPTTDQ